ncbi:MAG: DUF459 domain-containing protein [Gallionellaceae bacterium]|jgi:lysophospholipase L1-like esterase|nr:DUF459 domain-containing protein [Gallionellaceae bacterium]
MQTTTQTATIPATDSRRGLASVLLAFVVVIVVLESGGLLTWAERLEIGALRQIALPVVTLLHEGLQPLGIERLRERALALIEQPQGGDADTATNALPENTATATGKPDATTAQPLPQPQSQAVAIKPDSTGSVTTEQGTTEQGATKSVQPPVIDVASLSSVMLPASTASLPPLPPLPPDQPRVVALAGDSMMAVGLSDNLLRGMAGRKDLQSVRAFRSGTGLSRPEVFNWMTEYPKMISNQQPDVIIVAIGANDAQGFVENGKVVAFGTDAWVSIYAARVRQFLDMLTQHNAQVVWISLPPMRLEKFNEHINLLNRIDYAVVSQNPRAHWLNSASSLGDAKGNYREYARGKNDRVIRLRGVDGIHMSDEGAKLLAAPLLEWLSPPPAAAPDAAASAPQAAPVPAASSVPSQTEGVR